jgi:hypothetical protein
MKPVLSARPDRICRLQRWIFLSVTIDLAIYGAFSPTESTHSTLVAVDFDQHASFPADSIPSKTQAETDISPEIYVTPSIQ